MTDRGGKLLTGEETKKESAGVEHKFVGTTRGLEKKSESMNVGRTVVLRATTAELLC